MRTELRRTVVLIGAAFVLMFATSLVALATLQQPADFAPFTMTKEAWNAQLSSAGPGTEQFRIEYRSQNSWTVTLVSHSANPAMNGTTWSYERGGFTIFDAWRNFTRSNKTEATVDQWIEPGVFRSLASQSGWNRVTPSAGTTQLRRVDSPSGQAQVQTTVIFDEASELPMRVDVQVDGKLVQRITYTLVP